MNLRAKILALIAAMMGILYLLAAGTLLPDLYNHRLRMRRELGQVAAGSLLTELERVPPDNRRKIFTEERDRFQGFSLGAWAVTDEEGKVVAWSRNEPAPSQLGDLSYRLFDIVLPFQIDALHGRPWKLYAASPALDVSVDRELWSLFVAILLGGVLLGVAVYFMILRWVILPVERLASASRLAGDRGILTRVPNTSRKDEVGALIRSYNAMADEVNDLRLNLERRVAQAVADLESAQQKLVLSERLSVTGRLAAGVAHEINNPLGGMLNAARTLRQRAAEGSREAEYLDLMLEGLGRIQGIVSTMLHFARPTDRRLAVDLIEVSEGALMFCRHRFSALKLEPAREYPAGPLRVIGNRAELGQVFLNLLMNALDALEHQEPPVERRLGIRLAESGGQARITIWDSGRGMPPEVLARAGEVFFSTKIEGRGTGLGLAIVRHILAEHQGTLEIESLPGQGTTLSLTLPLEETGAPPVSAAAPGKEKERTDS